MHQAALYKKAKKQQHKNKKQNCKSTGLNRTNILKAWKIHISPQNHQKNLYSFCKIWKILQKD